MGKAIQQRLQQQRFRTPAHEAVLAVLLASSRLREQVEAAALEAGITGQQYNVLRILRGAHPAGLPRCDVARRMIERAPDLTRILDRLVKEHLVERARSEHDARLSVARITRKGLAALDRVDPKLEGMHEAIADRIGERDARTLTRICERLIEG
jgi:DNA-binding MarR family transcriptional regulator